MDEKNKEVVEGMTAEQIQALIKERDDAKAALTGVVDEVKTIRQKKQEAEAKAEALLKELNEKNSSGNKDTEDVSVIVERTIAEKLKEQNAATRKQAEDQAWSEFVKANPEFDPATDVSGLRTDVFKKELSKFNTASAQTKEDFLGVMHDAISLLYKKENKEYKNPYSSTPSRGASDTTIETPSNALSAAERETMKRLGWDEKKFLDIKSKHPELYHSVFKSN